MGVIASNAGAATKDLWRQSPLFRSPRQLALLDRFLIKDKMKDHVMKCFATRFISHCTSRQNEGATYRSICQSLDRKESGS